MAKLLYGLSEGITRKLIPWAQAETVDLLVMPCSESEVPASAQVKNKPIRGLRQRVKNRRPANQMSSITALWPEEGLCTKAEPFLVWVLAGRVQMQLGSQWISCRESTAIFIPPGLPHPDGSRPFVPAGEKGSCSLLWMRRCGRGLRCWISHSRDGRNLRPGSGESAYFPQEQIVQVFEILCDELQNRAPSFARRHALLLLLFLMQQELVAERAFDVAVYHPAREAEVGSSTAQRPMERACSHIQSHLGDPLTLESVARVVYMSRSTFARQFREYSGQTFLKYLQQHRLEHAQKFLRETDWTVRTISTLCGFTSYPSFNSFFFKCSGQTPARYRKQMRQPALED